MAVYRKGTLKQSLEFSGVGMHSGQEVRMQLIPSERGKIIFRRADLDGKEFPPDPMCMSTQNATSIAGPEQGIKTIEHLMAALFMLDIESLDIELDAGEIPIMDGSAGPFALGIQKAGRREIKQQRKWIKILSGFSIEAAGGSVNITPAERFQVEYAIDFSHPSIKRQEIKIIPDGNSFTERIAPARTFGFLKDYEQLRSLGLAAGARLDNVIVLDSESVLNPPLRFPDEFVRHKALDFIGDLSLAGAPLIGCFQAIRAGHALHLEAVRYLLAHPETFEYVTSP